MIGLCVGEAEHVAVHILNFNEADKVIVHMSYRCEILSRTVRTERRWK
jgi:hypothetical protein